MVSKRQVMYICHKLVSGACQLSCPFYSIVHRELAHFDSLHSITQVYYTDEILLIDSSIVYSGKQGRWAQERNSKVEEGTLLFVRCCFLFTAGGLPACSCVLWTSRRKGFFTWAAAIPSCNSNCILFTVFPTFSWPDWLSHSTGSLF